VKLARAASYSSLVTRRRRYWHQLQRQQRTHQAGAAFVQQKILPPETPTGYPVEMPQVLS
jgi:hypothetical protein